MIYRRKLSIEEKIYYYLLNNDCDRNVRPRTVVAAAVTCLPIELIVSLIHPIVFPSFSILQIFQQNEHADHLEIDRSEMID